MKTMCRYVCVALLVFASTMTAAASPILLSNPGFETVESTSDHLPGVFGDWSGDLSTIVAAENGITPAEGSRMLSFLGTHPSGPGGTSSGIWQLVDTSPWSAEIAAGHVTVSWSAAFNRVTGDSQSEPQFAVEINAYTGLPSAFSHSTFADHPLGTSGVSFLPTDADPATWETATANLLLPPETSYIAVLVAAAETLSDSPSDEFDGHYADQTLLQIGPPDINQISTPEPATLLLLSTGLVAVARRRSRTKRM